jgi:alkanesulfonate monooxygenase SsuD/methylene tetrahydromethanopterin reductase-like flavin-dependent oxidoreductase (luciferase family)
MRTRPGLIGFRISPVDAAALDWPRLAATWTLAGETRLFDAGWMSDHLTDASLARGGPSLESMTTLAALASRAPGMWVGVAVASNPPPPPGTSGETGRRPGQRDRRPIHPRFRRRLA